MAWEQSPLCCGVSDYPPVPTQGPSVQEPERRDESEGWSLSQPGQSVGGGTTAPALDGKALVSCPLPRCSAQPQPVQSEKYGGPTHWILAWMRHYQQEPEPPTATHSRQLAGGPPVSTSLDPYASPAICMRPSCPVCTRDGLGQ